MNMFSEEARRRRRKARDRIRFVSPSELRARLPAAGLAVVVSLLIPIATPVAAETVRRWIGLRDPEVLLWRPVSESHVALPIFVGFLTALVLGAAALVGGWPVLRRAAWVWIGLGLAAGASAALSLDSSVRIYADRVVVDAGATTESLRPGIYRFPDADQVAARCHWVSRRRDTDYVTIDYSVHFPDGGWIAFDHARPSGPRAAGDWFRTVARLDARAFGQTPHVAVREPGVACIRGLRADLGEADFADARRMMGLSDADFARYYAEPHEAWRRRPDDGL